MKRKLTDFEDGKIFYRGTIIVLENVHKSPKGDFDCKYGMINGVGKNFAILDLYRGIGGCIIHDLEPNVEGHFGCNKTGIKEWCKLYFKYFYTPEGYEEWSAKLDDIIYIEDLSDYFTQANRDLFMS